MRQRRARRHGRRRLRIDGQAARSRGGDEVADLASADGVLPERQLARLGVDEHDVHAPREGAEEGLDEHALQDRSIGVGFEHDDALEHEDVGHRIHELGLDMLAHTASQVERLAAHLRQKLAADLSGSVSMLRARIIDADEVHLDHSAHGTVVADQLGGVLVERPMLAPLYPDQGTLEVEAESVAIEVDDVHGAMLNTKPARLQAGAPAHPRVNATRLAMKVVSGWEGLVAK